MRKKCFRLISSSLAMMILMGSLVACGKDTVQSVNDSEDIETEVASDEDAVDTSATDVSEDAVEVPAGYNLVWHDEFNGTELNEDDWNREEHKAGWVNNELQEYIPSADYAFVEGGNLVIQPVKTEGEDGKVTYASGRVNTQNKHDIKYGYIEARIKFPEGQGFLPAFWILALVFIGPMVSKRLFPQTRTTLSHSQVQMLAKQCREVQWIQLSPEC